MAAPSTGARNDSASGFIAESAAIICAAKSGFGEESALVRSLGLTALSCAASEKEANLLVVLLLANPYPFHLSNGFHAQLIEGGIYIFTDRELKRLLVRGFARRRAGG
jgi:hypothetical protein